MISEKESNKILIESLESQISSLKQSLSKVQSNFEEVKVRSLILENEKTDMKFTLEQLREEKIKSNADIEFKNSLIIELELEKENNIESLNNLLKEKDKILQESEFHIKEIKLLKEENSKLKINLNQESELKKEIQEKADKTLNDKQQVIENLLQETESCKISISSKDKELAQTIEKYEEIVIINSDLNQKLLNLEQLKKESQDLIESLKKNISEKQSIEESHLSQINQLSSQFSQEKESNLSLSTKLRNLEENLNKEISNLNEAKVVLELKLAKNEEKLSETSNDLSLEKSEKDNLNSINFKQESEINQLKIEIKKLNQTIKELQSKYQELQDELDAKDNEVLDLKGKQTNEVSESLVKSKQEVELAHKLQEAAQAELNSVKSDLVGSLQARENLMTELRSLRDDELRAKRDLNESKKLLVKLKEDNAKLLKEIMKLNDENLKINESKSSDNSTELKDSSEKVKRLEDSLNSLEKQLKSKVIELEKCNRKILEMKKSSAEEVIMRKEIESQAQEIHSLTDGLSQITDVVFNLPVFKGEHPETSIIENTIKAIKTLYIQLQQKDKELSELKGKKRSDSISKPGIPSRGMPSRGK